MTIENQVITLEQAKRLKELGVNAPSLLKWINHIGFPAEVAMVAARRPNGYVNMNEGGIFYCETGHEQYPAYTVAEVFTMLPFGTTLIHNGYRSEDGKETMIFDVYACPHIEPGIDYRDYPPSEYGRKRITPPDWFLMSFNGWAEAAAEYLIYLLENNLHTIK